MELVLASQSPRRRELMALVTPRFVVDVSDVDESRIAAESPAALAGELAVCKAGAVHARRRADTVIGCDTVVELDGLALGKPVDEADAVRILRALSGKTHQVHTGVAVYLPGAKGPLRFTETTHVRFADIPEGEIAVYVKTTEPYDKAGAYGIQGWAARFVPAVNGCYYNVMGLPVARLYTVLAAHAPQFLGKI